MIIVKDLSAFSVAEIEAYATLNYALQVDADAGTVYIELQETR